MPLSVATRRALAGRIPRKRSRTSLVFGAPSLASDAGLRAFLAALGERLAVLPADAQEPAERAISATLATVERDAALRVDDEEVA